LIAGKIERLVFAAVVGDMVGQQPEEVLASAGNTGHYGADGNVEDAGNFLVRMILQMEKQQRRAEYFFEAVQGFVICFADRGEPIDIRNLELSTDSDG
jgi:hypothetical protein